MLAIKNDLKDVKTDCQTIKTVMKGFISDIKSLKEMMLKTVGSTSATHSAIEHDHNLDDLANVAAKDGEDKVSEESKSTNEEEDPNNS